MSGLRRTQSILALPSSNAYWYSRTPTFDLKRVSSVPNVPLRSPISRYGYYTDPKYQPPIVPARGRGYSGIWRPYYYDVRLNTDHPKYYLPLWRQYAHTYEPAHPRSSWFWTSGQSRYPEARGSFSSRLLTTISRMPYEPPTMPGYERFTRQHLARERESLSTPYWYHPPSRFGSDRLYRDSGHLGTSYSGYVGSSYHQSSNPYTTVRYWSDPYQSSMRNWTSKIDRYHFYYH